MSTDFQSGEPGSFRIPDCPAYWSLDPLGGEALIPEEARKLGFPDIIFGMEGFERSWGGSVYAGIRQFHEAKGLDPCSPAASVVMGRPLYQAMACGRGALSEHLHDTGSMPSNV
ncbi:hypothetical protein C8R47DRAFT_1141731 [Mycena vitilis]|nr:hypothetical protein C8R47DRAFT_1141731 [Mycena vitilis]